MIAINKILYINKSDKNCHSPKPNTNNTQSKKLI